MSNFETVYLARTRLMFTNVENEGNGTGEESESAFAQGVVKQK